MKIGCSICCEAYEDNAEVSAIICGHTFHQRCLNQWVNQSKTCPQCRKPFRTNELIKKLYFDNHDDSIVGSNGDGDVGRLRNELNSVQASLSMKEKDLSGVRAQVVELTQKKLQLTASLNDEMAVSKTLRGQVRFLKEQQKLVDVAKQEAHQAKQTMQELKDVRTILTGCETEIQELLSEKNANGDSKMKQMCTYVVALKRELVKFKELRDGQKRTLKDYNLRLLNCKQKLKDRDDKIADLEQRMKFYLMKSTPTQEKVADKSSMSTRSVAFSALKLDDSVICLDDTPKTLRTTKSAPKLTIDLDSSSADMFSPDSERSTAAAPRKRPRADDDDEVSLPDIYSYNILKPANSNRYESKKRVGYDGLGGHSSFIRRNTAVIGGGVKPKAKSAKSTITLKKSQKTLTSLYNMKLN
ncbi:E3 ubiquitin-protein ligase TRAIP-like [Tubulanus polymorphus]|uniref:E3 ubiquitin-protein ligase TRAIP-like n=1 Tax=Tubulanus polymorphus TaxID=672921 RepID=UPI003DA4E714